MRFPKNQGFDLIHGLVITVVLDDDISLTGRFLGEIGDRGHDHCGQSLQPINVNVDVDSEFILLQLVCEFEGDDIPEFDVGTIVAINVNKILFIAPGGECEDDKSS